MIDGAEAVGGHHEQRQPEACCEIRIGDPVPDGNEQAAGALDQQYVGGRLPAADQGLQAGEVDGDAFGAGGLLVPIRDAITYADLAARLGLPLLVVAANRLGTINHCALTARAAAAAGLTVLGFVLSQSSPERDASMTSNTATIEDLTGMTCLGEIPHLDDAAHAGRFLRFSDAFLAAGW